MSEENNFYYKGKFFKTEKEFWDYTKEFATRKTTKEDFDYIFETLKRDIWMNFFEIRKFDLSNSEFESIIEKIFIFSMNYMNQQHENSTIEKQLPK